jgi:hypothetical protein
VYILAPVKWEVSFELVCSVENERIFFANLSSGQVADSLSEYRESERRLSEVSFRDTSYELYDRQPFEQSFQRNPQDACLL